jgi:DNA-binding transcriptional LysR family regulator
MEIDIRSLRYLTALAKRLNFSRAADDLGISQPSLTRSLQALEMRLGMRLFDRDRSGVRPTTQGLAIIERARVLLGEFEDFERQARLSALGEGGRVRIGFAPLPARALLPSVMVEQFTTAPQLSLEVLVRNVDVLWPLLIADEIEFLVSAEGQVPDSASIRSEALGEFFVSLMVRANHPLLLGDCPGGQFPILLSSRRGLSTEIPEEICLRAPSEPHVVEDFRTATELMQASDAIWLTSPYALIGEFRRGEISELPQSASLHQRRFRMMIYSLERRTQSPAARNVREALRRGMRQISELWPMPLPTDTH